MKSMHSASVTRLNEEISRLQDLLVYWVDVSIVEPHRHKEVLGKIAEVKADLASLRMERKTFVDDI